MKASISVDEKKEFIRWLISTHQMKMREAMWVLNYIAGHDQIMEYVHFVDDLEGVPRGLVLSAQGVENEPFRFSKGDVTTSDPEKAFHDIRLNWDEELFIKLHFEGALSSPEYALVRDENPYLEVKLDKKEQQLAVKFLNQSLADFSRAKLLEAIDEALDNRDEETFRALLKTYQHLD
ncbi:ReoY family proteolytic degradation factor [Listeria ilorinensis]|uniref:ReoY family proteolytic degradation factor n=1 Tax=Listeria ilorinensis TaxID=2867439 RepID=UPI001EF6458F|nr:ReoY family proteolytic degradation factor [Listeria ilorinensis]